MNPGAEQITRLRAELVSGGRHGSQARDWANATSATITGCAVQPLMVAESPLDQAFIAQRLQVLAPPGVDLVATDRIVYAEVTYEVDGGAQHWRDQAGRPDHVELVIKRLAG